MSRPIRWSLALLALACAGGCSISLNFGGKPEPTDSSGADPDLTDTGDGGTIGTTDTAPATDTTAPLTFVIDEFAIGLALLDVLFVVDNSASMADEQDHLVTEIGSFLDLLVGSDLDYHIGVTSTDLDNSLNGTKGKLRTFGGLSYIDTKTADPQATFVGMAAMGTSGSNSEKGLGAAYLAIEDDAGTNGAFYRDDAALHTIVVTDEPDYSASVVTITDFITWYDGLKTDPADASLSCLCDPDLGGTYLSVASAVDGLQLSVADDWTASLAALGAATVDLTVPPTTFLLTGLPIEETLELTVEEVDGNVLAFVVGTDWTYDAKANSVSFLAYVPPHAGIVRVTYALRE